MGANGNLTKRLHLDQAKQFSDRRKENNINTESWQMSGDHFFVMQGTINRATLFNKLQPNNLSKNCFKKYFDNMSGNIGIAFDGCNSILSVPLHDIIHHSHIVMIFGKLFDQSRPWGPVFRFKNNPEYTHHVFQQFASEYFGDLHALSQLFVAHKECLFNAYCTQCIAAESSLFERKSKQPNFYYDAAPSFQSRFDNICKYSFLNCFSSFNGYSMPILRTSNFRL